MKEKNILLREYLIKEPDLDWRGSGKTTLKESYY